MSIPRNSPTAAPSALPASPEEAERRYYRRYGWALVVALLGGQAPAVAPVTVEQWVRLAELTRDALGAPAAERLATMLEALAAELRAGGEQAEDEAPPPQRRSYGRH